MTYFNNYDAFTAPGRPISSDGTTWFQLTDQCTDPSSPSKSGWVLPAPQIDPPDIPDNADTTPGRPRTSKPPLDPPDGAYTMRSLKKLYQCTDPSAPSKSGWVLPAPQIDPLDIPRSITTLFSII